MLLAEILDQLQDTSPDGNPCGMKESTYLLA